FHHLDEDEEEVAIQQTIVADEQSLPSVSTFDLPSPALSSTGAVRAGRKKAEKEPRDKEGSWVWRWAEKRTTNGETKAFCAVKGCRQKTGYAFAGSSTTNLIKHLSKVHGLSQDNQNDGSFSGRASIGDALTNQGKRSSAHFSTEELEQKLCKVLVRHKLPYTFVQSSALQELLHLAHAAPSMNDLKLPSNDTITRR
ncbi:hypothetical protein EDD11_000654, partial [Mortierella claussenii]